LWNFCDDHGVHPASYLRLKAEVFPIDILSVDNIRSLLGELISAGLVREYMVGDAGYWLVTGWGKHQRIDKPTYRHPLPLSDLKKVEDCSENILDILDDSSTNVKQIVSEDSTRASLLFCEASKTDRNGKERREIYVKLKLHPYTFLISNPVLALRRFFHIGSL
jgi:hypothetical protein